MLTFSDEQLLDFSKAESKLEEALGLIHKHINKIPKEHPIRSAYTKTQSADLDLINWINNYTHPVYGLHKK